MARHSKGIFGGKIGLGTLVYSLEPITPTPTPTPTPAPPPAPPPPPPPPTAGAINAPSVTRSSVAGTAPFEWTPTADATVYAGDIWRVQTSATSDFAILTQDITKQISPSEFEPGYVSDWTAGANPAPSAGFQTPSGTFYFRLRVERYTENGTIASAWSNIVTDTIVVATTVFQSATGFDKNQYIVVQNGRTVLMDRNDVGASCFTRATQQPTSEKVQVEVLINSLHVDSQSYISIENGTTEFGPSSFNIPAAGTAGITIAIDQGGIQMDGAGGGDYFSGAGILAVGDIVAIEIDKRVGADTTGTIKFFRVRGAEVTQVGPTKTVDWTNYFLALGHRRIASFTANFGQEPFAKPLAAGFNIYG